MALLGGSYSHALLACLYCCWFIFSGRGQGMSGDKQTRIVNKLATVIIVLFICELFYLMRA